MPASCVEFFRGAAAGLPPAKALAQDLRLPLDLSVERKGGVALFEGAELLQIADTRRKRERLVAFGDDDRGFAKQRRFFQSVQNRMIVALVGVRRIEKHKIKRR